MGDLNFQLKNERRFNISKKIENEFGFKLIRRANPLSNLAAKDDYIKENLFYVKADSNKLNKARKLILRGLRLNPQNELLWASLGYLYHRKGNFCRAIKCFFKAIEINPANVDNWFDLGIAYGAHGDEKVRDFIFANYGDAIITYFYNFNKIDNQVLYEIIESLEKNQKTKDRHYESFPKILNLNEHLVSVTKPPAKKTKKKILFINPPIEEPFIGKKEQFSKENRAAVARQDDGCYYTDDTGFLKKEYAYNLPIGLLRIADKLLNEGNEIYFLDCVAPLPPAYLNSRWRIMWPHEHAKSLTNKWFLNYFHLGLTYPHIGRVLSKIKKIDEIYVGCTFTYHNEGAHKVIDICRKAFPKARIKFGGIYPTLAPKEAKKSKADEIFIGRYPGTEDTPLNYHILGYNPGYSLIKGTSGCPHNCAYCAVHTLEGNKFHFRNPNMVFGEILDSYTKYNIREIGIWDSNLLINYDKYFGAILKLIRRKKLKLRLYAPEGLDYRLITQRIANNLKNSGFLTVSIALENFDSAFTKTQLNRQNNIMRFRQTIRHLKKAGFKGAGIRVFIMTGLPNQPLKNIIGSIKFVWSLGCNAVIFPFTPIPMTRIYEENYNKLKNKRLKDLHPLCYPFVSDKADLNYLIEISKLNLLNEEKKTQSKHFKEAIHSKQLIKMLS